MQPQGSFKEEVGISAAEVFVGGSVGQGTAVTHHYDLDLVLYSHSECIMITRGREEGNFML